MYADAVVSILRQYTLSQPNISSSFVDFAFQSMQYVLQLAKYQTAVCLLTVQKVIDYYHSSNFFVIEILPSYLKSSSIRIHVMHL